MKYAERGNITPGPREGQNRSENRNVESQSTVRVDSELTERRELEGERERERDSQAA